MTQCYDTAQQSNIHCSLKINTIHSTWRSVIVCPCLGSNTHSGLYFCLLHTGRVICWTSVWQSNTLDISTAMYKELTHQTSLTSWTTSSIDTELSYRPNRSLNFQSYWYIGHNYCHSSLWSSSHVFMFTCWTPLFSCLYSPAQTLDTTIVIHCYCHIILWTTGSVDTSRVATATLLFERPVLVTHWAQLLPHHSLNFQSCWHFGDTCCYVTPLCPTMLTL